MIHEPDESTLISGTGVVIFDLGSFQGSEAYSCIVATAQNEEGQWTKDLIFILYGPEKGRVYVNETISIYGALIGKYTYVTFSGDYEEIPAIVMEHK